MAETPAPAPDPQVGSYRKDLVKAAAARVAAVHRAARSIKAAQK